MQPDAPHRHWHVDVSCINDVEIVVQKALEKFSAEKPRIISDNGSQFTAGDFKRFVRLVGITLVRTSPYYPQSNGKLERWHGSLKQDCIRPACPATIKEARDRRALSRQAVASGAVA